MLQGNKLRHTGGRGGIYDFKKCSLYLLVAQLHGHRFTWTERVCRHDVHVAWHRRMSRTWLIYACSEEYHAIGEDWLKRKESEHVLCFEFLPCPIRSMRNVPRTLNWTKGDWFVRRGRITSRQPLSTSLDLFTATVKKKQKIITVWVLDQDYNG